MEDLPNRQSERQFRSLLLLRELGFQVAQPTILDGIWSVSFQDANEFSALAVLDPDQRFLELGCAMTFSVREQDFLRERMDELMQCCYHRGCYFTIVTEKAEIRISLFSKLYFSGLQYYALEETCADLKNAVEELRKLFEH